MRLANCRKSKYSRAQSGDCNSNSLLNRLLTHPILRSSTIRSFEIDKDKERWKDKTRSLYSSPITNLTLACSSLINPWTYNPEADIYFDSENDIQGFTQPKIFPTKSIPGLLLRENRIIVSNMSPPGGVGESSQGSRGQTFEKVKSSIVEDIETVGSWKNITACKFVMATIDKLKNWPKNKPLVVFDDINHHNNTRNNFPDNESVKIVRCGGNYFAPIVNGKLKEINWSGDSFYRSVLAGLTVEERNTLLFGRYIPPEQSPKLEERNVFALRKLCALSLENFPEILESFLMKPSDPLFEDAVAIIVRDIQTMGSWNNIAGEVVIATVADMPNWPKKKRLEVFKGIKDYKKRGKTISDDTCVKLVLQDSHFSPIIEGKILTVAGDGDCFYRSVLTALSTDEKNRLLDNKYEENPDQLTFPKVDLQ